MASDLRRSGSWHHPRERRRSVRSLWCFLVLLHGGCYRYDALEQPTPALGSRVEAHLTDAGSVQMASQIGPGIITIRGEVVRSDSEALLLALTSVVGRNEQEVFWKGEQVSIPLGTIRRVDQRRFALGKSVLFAGAVVGGLFGATKAFEGGDRGGGGSGTGGGPQPQ